VERLGHPGDVERVRVWAPISTAARAAANGVGLTILDGPVLANGRLELRGYVREQSVSRVVHRYGSLADPAATE
jgi:RHH-type proline utilization regulon transcriptional repressor/proline dehydrogenase/delta 1-pyrroline-5-carboxylate dehydrogenase